MAKPGKIRWTKDELRELADHIMHTWNPYKYTLKKDDWFKDVRFDRRPQTWSFRGTDFRVETSIEIPYLVWYPNVDNPDPNNGGDWPPEPQTEQLLVGFVGAGGW